ncbi:TRAP transporter large permease [Yunchengibacter salinarum]|uniref:TRAP transporter large permease n=1 Tax=Yunchengibacter salinarum TaxID=3133399 RepID=UPI0035B5C54B
MSLLLDALPFLMFAALVPLLFTGYPVAFVLGGTGLLFWAIAVMLGAENPQSFFLVVSRIFGGVVEKPVLIAVPMFVLMGTLLARSGIADDLLRVLDRLTRRVPGGLALSVTLLGVVLAATTGIIGASVVMMTLMALPMMRAAGYDTGLATGTIAASGTLGILLPPSIMLVVMADLLSMSAGTLFMAAIGPGLLLAGFYMLYLLITALFRPHLTPPHGEDAAEPVRPKTILTALLPPVGLIALVLGSIFGGIATPTEASGVGAFGALLLALARRRLSLSGLRGAVESSALTTIMIFGLFVGATAFSYVFTLLGGHDHILALMNTDGSGAWLVLGVLMLATFLLGFFFDWIEITLILLPVFAPVITALDFGGHVPPGTMTTAWFAMLMAVNLQTSFLTPPFGFALFYMKGAAPGDVRLATIYRGIVPFVALQALALLVLALFPNLALWLPRLLAE